MKIDNTVKKETLYIACFGAILSMLMQAVFLIIGQWHYSVLLGNLWGYAAAVSNFLLLGLTVQKAVTKEPEEAKKLIETTKQSFFEALKVVKPGARIGDISAKVQHFVENAGFNVLKDFSGHGIGRNLHEDPNIPNYGKSGTGALIKEGMCLAIEPMVALGSDRYEILNDGWTVRMLDRKISAHYENSIAVTKDGIIILTMSDEEEKELNG